MFARAVRSTNTWDAVRFENENVASIRLHKVVAHLVHKNLIPQIRIATHNRVSLPVLLTELRIYLIIGRTQPELAFENFRRDPNRISSSGGHSDQGPVP